MEKVATGPIVSVGVDFVFCILRPRGADFINVCITREADKLDGNLSEKMQRLRKAWAHACVCVCGVGGLCVKE